MKIALLGILILFSFSNICFATETRTKNKKSTTSDDMSSMDISESDLCNVSCESSFSKCYEADKKKALKCLGDVTTCKSKCEKISGGKK